jgi:broad specificity phosphatase PhoE
MGNVDKTIYAHTPDYKVDLTKLGHQQARDAGVEIATAIGDESIYVYHSPWMRTRQTFQGIRDQMDQNIVRAIEDPRLREQDWGHFKEVDFLKAEHQARADYGRFYFRLQDGESGADVYDRISTFMESLHRDFSKPDYPKNALIVTHGITLLVFCMRWFHWSVEEFESYRNPLNGQVVTMVLQPDGHYALQPPLATH